MSGGVFRLVEQDPPTAEDFKSYLERGLAPSADDCQRAGLSTYLEKKHAEATRKRIPKLNKHFVALADLEPEHGRIKATGGRGHHTLWLKCHALELAPTLFAVAE